MSLQRSKQITLGFAIVGAIACLALLGLPWAARSLFTENLGHIEDCYSPDVYRVKLGNTEFNIPGKWGRGFLLGFGITPDGAGIPVSENSTEISDHPGVFQTLRSTDRSSPFFGTMACQKKDKVPFDAGMSLSLSQIEKSIRRGRRLEHIIIALPEAVWPNRRDNLFKISEIPDIQIQSDSVGPDTRNHLFPNQSVTIFAIGERQQQISCTDLGCFPLAVQDEDGLVYLVEPNRFIRNYKDRTKGASTEDTFDLVPAEDLPESVYPVLNFARNLRASNAEGNSP